MSKTDVIIENGNIIDLRELNPAPRYPKLKNKTILITGGTRGIGHSIAKQLVENGANVIIAGRAQEVNLEMLKRDNVRYIQWDVTEKNSFQEKLEKAESLFGVINCLVNNAGVISVEKSENVKAELREIMRINTESAYNMAELFHGYWKEKHVDGLILNILSNTEKKPAMNAYAISKWAERYITEKLGHIYEKDNIRVMAIDPGPVKTRMSYKEGQSLIKDKIPYGRIAVPEEVANLAVFMIANSDICNGKIIAVDGGES